MGAWPCMQVVNDHVYGVGQAPRRVKAFECLTCRGVSGTPAKLHIVCELCVRINHQCQDHRTRELGHTFTCDDCEVESPWCPRFVALRNGQPADGKFGGSASQTGTLNAVMAAADAMAAAHAGAVAAAAAAQGEEGAGGNDAAAAAALEEGFDAATPFMSLDVEKAAAAIAAKAATQDKDDAYGGVGDDADSLTDDLALLLSQGGVGSGGGREAGAPVRFARGTRGEMSMQLEMPTKGETGFERDE